MGRAAARRGVAPRSHVRHRLEPARRTRAGAHARPSPGRAARRRQRRGRPGRRPGGTGRPTVPPGAGLPGNRERPHRSGAPALPAGLLESGRHPGELPAVLRHQRPGGRAGRGRRGLRAHPRTDPDPVRRRSRRRRARRPRRRAARPRGLPEPPATAAGRPRHRRGEDPRTRRGTRRALARGRHDGLRVRRPRRGTVPRRTGSPQSPHARRRDERDGTTLPRAGAPGQASAAGALVRRRPRPADTPVPRGARPRNARPRPLRARCAGGTFRVDRPSRGVPDLSRRGQDVESRPRAARRGLVGAGARQRDPPCAAKRRRCAGEQGDHRQRLARGRVRLAAAERGGHGQGVRGHRHLPLPRPLRARGGRERPRPPGRRRRHVPPIRWRRPRPQRDLDTRLQAKRGRPLPARRALGGQRGVGRPGPALAPPARVLPGAAPW